MPHMLLGLHTISEEKLIDMKHRQRQAETAA
jgi:hypothetical protein